MTLSVFRKQKRIVLTRLSVEKFYLLPLMLTFLSHLWVPQEVFWLPGKVASSMAYLDL